MYVGLGILTVLGGVGFLSMSSTVPPQLGVNWLPTKSTIEWIALLALTAIAILIVALDRHQRSWLLTTALEDSDLQVTRFGVIRYREPAAVSTDEPDDRRALSGTSRSTSQP
jgi:hypothetical protein